MSCSAAEPLYVRGRSRTRVAGEQLRVRRAPGLRCTEGVGASILKDTGSRFGH